jgi:hypothetical protein
MGTAEESTKRCSDIRGNILLRRFSCATDGRSRRHTEICEVQDEGEIQEEK